VDLPATCLAAAGVDAPDWMARRDLIPYWESAEDVDDQDAVYMEAKELRGIRTRRWKFVHYQGCAYGELYDLQADPGEMTNLWDDASLADVAQELTRQLLDKMIEVSPRSRVPWNRGAPAV
jgi:uncharacterized sulfatase